MNITSAMRRMWRGGRNEVASITAIAGIRNSTCRLTK